MPALISFVIPAHNEERFLPGSIGAIRRAFDTLDEQYEIVVVDDGSTDRTAAVAAGHGAVVVSIADRQIAAARHAGAAAARGEVLIFVDADTIARAELVREAIDALSAGAVGGAAIARFDGRLPLWARGLTALWSAVARAMTLFNGCFMFCTRAAYDASGGFDRTLFAAEDVAFGRALQRVGRVVILRHRVETSGRNLRRHTLRDAARLLVAAGRGGSRVLRSREALGFWYSARRSNDSAAVPPAESN